MELRPYIGFVVAKEKGLANTNKIGFEFRKSRYEISNDTSSSMDKVLLWEQIEDWYRSFLSEAKVSGKDKAIVERLQHRLRRFIDDAIVTDIYTDLKANKWHIGVWLKLCRRETVLFPCEKKNYWQVLALPFQMISKSTLNVQR